MFLEGTMMEPTEILTAEHRIIGCGLSVLSAIGAQVEGGRPISLSRLRSVLEFFQRYIEVHRQKEEEILFTALAEVGIARTAGPIAIVTQEHKLGAALVAAMRGCTERELDAPARREFAQLAHRFVQLERKHIDREERAIFPLVRQKLPPAVRQRLMDQFDQHRLRHAGEQTRCVALLEPLLDVIAA
jgi:hemerythrin-like domain-containing protein